MKYGERKYVALSFALIFVIFCLAFVFAPNTIVSAEDDTTDETTTEEWTSPPSPDDMTTPEPIAPETTPETITEAPETTPTPMTEPTTAAPTAPTNPLPTRPPTEPTAGETLTAAAEPTTKSAGETIESSDGITYSDVAAAAAPKDLTAVTGAKKVTWTSKDTKALISEEAPDIAQYAAMILKNGEYVYTEISFENGVISIMVENGDIFQIFMVEKGVVLDEAIPSYVSYEYLYYMTQKMNEKLSGYNGYIPSPIPGAAAKNDRGLTVNSAAQTFKRYSAAEASAPKAYPAKYDIKTKPYFPAVKDQGTTSLCWDFSSIGAIELLYGMRTGKKYDFSESNLAYQLSNKSRYGFQRGPVDAGNFEMSTAYMSRWEGPVSEQDDPFENILNGVSVPDADTVVYLTGWERVPYEMDTVKNYIVEYGSVVSSVYTPSPDYMYSAYYTSNKEILANHAVQIVGWDDDYPVTRFENTPPVKGAWIIKNSWGTRSGDNGYYYVSYADTQVSKNLYAVTGVASADKYDNLYLFDHFGVTGSINFNTDSVWFGNVFTANRPGEQIAAVSFYNPHLSASYEVWVGLSGDMNKRTLAASGALTASGYFTVNLSDPILIENPGFSVMVNIKTDGIAVVSLQKNSAGYIENAVAVNNTSFYSRDGIKWTDAYDRSAMVCLKVITVDPKEAAAIPSYHKVELNGEEVAISAYLINDYNNFKLRDLAFILNGTEKQFSVDWVEKTNTIDLFSKKAYIPVGGEMAAAGSLGNKTAKPTTSAIMLDGKPVRFIAYNIEGNNYFKLRDVMKAFDVYVGFDEARGVIILDTSRGYADNT